MQGLQIADFTNKRWKLGTVGFLVVALKLFVGTKPIKAHLQDCTSKADITLIKEAVVHTAMLYWTCWIQCPQATHLPEMNQS